MTSAKKAILFAHRWLGFISGLMVFIVSVTGCIYCFQDEIQDLIYDYRKVETEAKPFLNPSYFQQRALQAYPEGKVTLFVYSGEGRAVQVRLLDKTKALSLYFNPYSGKYLATENLKDSFFAFIKNTHLYLFLPKAIGKMVNGVSVIVFVVIMITGIVLWWPKRRSDRKRSFTIKWKGRWRRVNYDLHNVLGFYAAAIVIVLAITGLSYSFKLMSGFIYATANLGRVFPAETAKFKSDSTAISLYPDSALVIDRAYGQVKEKSPLLPYLLILPGAKSSAPLSVIAYPEPLHFSYSDNYAFDRYSGKLLKFFPNKDKSAGLKLNGMNYDIHTGQIAGLTGKIVAFLCSLISASLPVTGLILYLGKKKKPKKKHHLSAKKLQSYTS